MVLHVRVGPGLGGLVDSVADGSIETLDPSVYDTIPQRVFLPAD